MICPENNPNGPDSSPEPPASAKAFSWLPIAGVVLIGIACLALWHWGESFIALIRDQERFRAWLADFGPLAPAVSIGLNVIQVVLAPVPGQAIGFVNGYLFGVFWGTVYSLIGVMLGSAVAMGLGRWLGRPIIERLVSPSQLARWDDLAARRGPIFFFLVFLLPLVSDDIASFAVGLSSLSIPYILALAAVGRLPGLVASNWVGANVNDLSPAGWMLLIGGTLVLFASVLRYRERIEVSLLRFAERWSSHF